MTNAVKWIAALVLISGASFLMSSYHLELFQKLLLVTTLAVGFNYLFGICGQIAFSHVGFYAVGAYAVVILTHKVGLPLWLGIAGATAICALIALIVAIPATRLEGFYLALATLAFAQLILVILSAGGSVTGGEDGISGYVLPDLFGLSLVGPYYTPVIAIVFLATLALLMRVDKSYFGRACRAIRDNPEAASAMGVNVPRTKIVVFVLTSTLAGVVGMVFAFVNNYVSPPIFDLERMFELLFMIIIGGTGRHAGAIVGAVLLYSLQFAVEPLVGKFHLLIYGLVVVLVILFAPKGLMGIWDSFVTRRDPRRPVEDPAQ